VMGVSLSVRTRSCGQTRGRRHWMRWRGFGRRRSGARPNCLQQLEEHGKPDPRLVGHALAKLEVPASHTIIIEDTSDDAEVGLKGTQDHSTQLPSRRCS
jgi:hypothetical protein